MCAGQIYTPGGGRTPSQMGNGMNVGNVIGIHAHNKLALRYSTHTQPLLNTHIIVVVCSVLRDFGSLGPLSSLNTYNWLFDFYTQPTVILCTLELKLVTGGLRYRLAIQNGPFLLLRGLLKHQQQQQHQQQIKDTKTLSKSTPGNPHKGDKVYTIYTHTHLVPVSARCDLVGVWCIWKVSAVNAC